MKRFILTLAIVGLFIHLGIIFFARNLDPLPAILSATSTTYLSALYTPFSFVLFYEVFLLVLSVPKSMTASIGRQYEIISLITIRNVFKDISQFEGFKVSAENLEYFWAVLIDMGGGLLMFLFVAIFYHLRKKILETVPLRSQTKELEIFIDRKKGIAVILSAILVGLAAYNLVWWATDVYQVAFYDAVSKVDVTTIFYIDLFSVMIFSDVLILLFSMLHADNYRLVLRNAGFLISTVLIRFSFTIEKPYDVEVALGAMLFGILVLLVYYYHVRVLSGKRAEV